MRDKPGLVARVVLVSCFSIALMYGTYVFLVKGKEAEKVNENIEESIPRLSSDESQKTSVTFAAAGDNLIHDNIYMQASQRAGGNGFDFFMPYEKVERLIKGTDIAFINQESPIAEDVAPISGYPRFNSPKAVGERMVDLGFNLIGISNNHMFDKNTKGLLAHMDFWESQDILLCMGAWRTPENMEKPLLIEKNDITFGFIPMTEHTNGLNAEKGSPVRYIRTDEWDLIKKQLDLINKASDFQVASIHWGIENSLDASSEQRSLAKRLSDEGIDLIIGCHSHTLQPVEWIVRKDGTRTLVIYSLGNFISSMMNSQNMLGGIMHMTIEKDFSTNETYIQSARLHPIVTQYEGRARKNVRIIPLDEYTDELAANHGVKADYPGFSLSYLEGIVKRNVPYEFLSDVPVNPC